MCSRLLKNSELGMRNSELLISIMNHGFRNNIPSKFTDFFLAHFEGFGYQVDGNTIFSFQLSTTIYMVQDLTFLTKNREEF